MRVLPMLAHPGGVEDLGREHYVWSAKLDGIRCIAHCDGNGGVVLINRARRDITFRYPDIVAALAEEICVPLVLDGELVAYDARGYPSFSLIAQRDSVTKPASVAVKVAAIPATFEVFDLLAHRSDHTDMRSYALETRLTLLRRYSMHWTKPLSMVDHFDEGHALWNEVLKHGLEGVVGKHIASKYTGKRDRNWIKVKQLHRVSCVATGYEPGEGARSHTIGAILLSVFDAEGALVPVGKVGTGFNARSLAECKALLDAQQPFIAEIECLSLGTGGQLRHPSFKGIRTDLGLADATVAQLDTIPGT